ncbi:MAG: hypothetical protein LBH09_05740 [Peptococcaceae bacterium]|jgi:hypothetical protein|nr:hypothetical protein [Peptococcaceae bacterium]
MGREKQVRKGEKVAIRGLKKGALCIKEAVIASKVVQMGEGIAYNTFPNRSDQPCPAPEFADLACDREGGLSEFTSEPEVVLSVQVIESQEGTFTIMFNGEKIEGMAEWDAFVDEITTLDDLMYQSSKENRLSLLRGSCLASKSGTHNQ